MKTLLTTKPAEITGSIPVLPPIPAAQVFHAQTRYLDFANGSGVGFVTHYAQDVSPVTAEQPFYTFQGLTNDGQYYVVVFSPVTTALLPADFDAALGGVSYDEWAKNYETYLADIVAQLNGLLPGAYTPDLTLIDGLVKSIEIGAQPQTGAQIANPASVNCTKQGGTLVIQKRGDGREYGVCLFEDNRQCEEWALLNGECPVGGLKITGYVTPASQYCAITGGTYDITGNSGTPQETGTCTFKNGKRCGAGEYYNGQCAAAAASTWAKGKKGPKTEQLHSLAGQGAMMGAFWGMLFGLLFFIPFFGLAVGAAMGALSGKFADYGIDDNFIKQTREKVTEGTSALFLLTSGAVMDKLAEFVKGQKFEIISTNLSKEQEDALRAQLSEE